MARYWRIYQTFFSSSLIREMEFRANFFAKIAQNLVWIVFSILILLVIYSRTDNIAGWSRGDAFILAATTFVTNAVISAFFFSLMDIPSQVRLGTLDFVVTKPVDSQFWVSTRRFNFDQVGSLIAGFVLIAIGISSNGYSPSLAQWLAYLTLVGGSVVLFYAFYLILMTTGIWLVRVDNLWVLGESVTGIARYPLDIYELGLQRFMTFIVPLAFLATIPTRQLTQGLDLPMVGVGLGWAAGLFVAARLFWRFAMRSYTSASS